MSRITVLSFLLAISCAHQPVRPMPFATSTAFHAVSGSIYSILERDLDADGLNEAVVVSKTAHGYVPAAFRQEAAEGMTVWKHVCDGEVALGTELEIVSYIEVADGALALIVAQDENPDEQVQSFVLIDPRDSCATRLKDRLELPLPSDTVLAPGAVPAGVLVATGEPGFKLVDQPRLLHLTSGEGSVDLLTGVRVREVNGSRVGIDVREHMLTFLKPATLTATWRIPDVEAAPLAELVDGDPTTGLSLRADATGTLVVESDLALAVLELVHGCYGDARAELELDVGQGGPFVTGAPAPPTSFVAATGKSFTDSSGGRHELLALREPKQTLAITLGPAGRERCLKELRAFGFVGTPRGGA
jgi:hypothetical protein